MTSGANADAKISLDEAAQEFRINRSTLAAALGDGSLKPVGADSSGRPLFKRGDIVPLAEANVKARIYASLSGRPDFGSGATDRHLLFSDLPYLARLLVNADYAALTIINSRGRITEMFVSGMSQRQAAAIGDPPVGRGVLGHMGPHGATLRLHDIATDPRSVGLPDGHPPMTAMIGAAITQEQTHAANLYVTRSPGREPFTAEHQMILESLAAFGQTALEAERMRRVEEDLRKKANELEAAKSEFLSMISHDLRNPIAAMAMSAEKIKSAIGDIAGDDLDALAESLSAMDSLVSNLLDMSRLESGAFPMELEQCFLTDVAHDAAARIAKTPAANGREIRLDIPHELPPVFCDPIQIRRVIENLITNALKYSNGEISITGGDAGGRVRCQVDDRGDGVPEQEREMIFKRFYRTNHHSGVVGTGLGLAICKTIVNAHNGEIGVGASEHGGASFWFSLPVDDASEQSPSKYN